MSASERREEILEAAVAEFAVKGLHGTSTETIAERAGVSQPYLFRLFGTKKDLFLATIERGFDRVERAFRQAAQESPGDELNAMAYAYISLLGHREALLVQMHAYAACADPDVRRVVQARFGQLYRFVADISGAEAEKLQQFFATGMLLNVAAAMDLASALDGEEWVSQLLGPVCSAKLRSLKP
jgi:AcrR family transcriptional regulator